MTRRSQSGLAKAGVSATLAHRAHDIQDGDPVRAFLRSLDYFPTQPWAARALAELVMRVDGSARSAWEPACGEGIMAYAAADYFDRMAMTDVHDYGVGGRVLDFLRPDAECPGGAADWIITNPPFEHAKAFVQLALQRARRGVAMFVRLGFLETVGRYELFEGPMAATFACPYIERVGIRLGDCDVKGGTAAAYMAVIWITDPDLKREFSGRAELRPFPPGTRARLSRPADVAFLDRLRSTRAARLMPVAA